MLIKLSEGWKRQLGSELELEYIKRLQAFLLERKKAGATVFPRAQDCMEAFHRCPPENVKVVILGQDPYHGMGQAHGLSFSVPYGIACPPSLINIYKELASDVGFENPGHGHLLSWAEQGVLLLNSVLTVEMGRAGSHAGRGWERFTDKVIEVLSSQGSPKVFFLWGAYAQKKGQHIDRGRHLVLESVHPSPLSAYRGFFGSRPFSKANRFLESHGRVPIRWQLPKLRPVENEKSLER